MPILLQKNANKCRIIIEFDFKHERYLRDGLNS